MEYQYSENNWHRHTTTRRLIVGFKDCGSHTLDTRTLDLLSSSTLKNSKLFIHFEFFYHLVYVRWSPWTSISSYLLHTTKFFWSYNGVKLVQRFSETYFFQSPHGSMSVPLVSRVLDMPYSTVGLTLQGFRFFINQFHMF